MKQIQLYLLASLLFLVISCAQEDDTPKVETCDGSLIVTSINPGENPSSGPVLIKGMGFDNSVRVTFDDFRAPIEVQRSTELVTRVPTALLGQLGSVELKVTQGACEVSSIFRVLGTYPNRFTPSPPDIILLDESPLVEVSLQDSIEKYLDLPQQEYYFSNTWVFQGEQKLTVTSISQSGNIIAFEGFERIGSLDQQIPYEGTFNIESKEVRLILDRKGVEEAIEPDILEGGFYELTTQTPDGLKTDHFLFTTSQITGRQYLFDI